MHSLGLSPGLAGGAMAPCLYNLQVCICTVVGERYYRFPDSGWWAKRSALRKVPAWRIEMRPDDAREYGTDVESIVRRMAERIVKLLRPVAVWLFGSMARGDCNERSDIDLMIVMPDGTDCMAATVTALVGLRGAMLPCDIMVNTAGEFERAADNICSVQHDARMHGVMLYG